LVKTGCMDKLVFALFIFLICNLNIYSQQVKSFTADTVLYIEQLKKYSSSYLKESDKPMFEKFINYWNAGKFTWKEMKEIVEISNLLLKRYARTSPDYINYFEVLLLVKTDSFGTAHARIPEWKKIIRYYLEQKDITFKTTQQFLVLSLGLLKENTLFASQSVRWKSLQSDFYFDFNNGSPFVRFDGVDLICNAKRDSISINKASGYVDPVELNWFGEKGLVTWERAGLSKDSVYAELSDYKISLRRTDYKADSVRFTYKKYFDTPLEGRLDEQVMAISHPSQALYPKFFTYQNTYILPDLFPGIQYIGGLSMQGSKLVGTGSEYEPAILEIYEKDTLRMLAKTRQFLFLTNSITSPSVRVTIYIAVDSIYHPDVIFNYQEQSDVVRLTKSDSYNSASPYDNSYHKINMNFDELYWKRDSREIILKPMTGSAQGNAFFESDNFFNYSFWEQLQGRDNSHPLVNLWQYSRGIGGIDQFPVINYSNFLGIESSQVRHQLMRLSRNGFIYYNDVSDLIRINKKLYYFLDASIGKTDYDVIYFASRVRSPQANAKLNLDNLDLHIYGIQNIFLSDSQNVVLLPANNQIIMKKNRDFQFDGVIKAGLFTYYGSNFFFEYDTFKINLQKIDSLRLEIKTGERDNFGHLIIRDINNIIEQITGNILIDHPANKSGLEDYPEYPVFTSLEDAYVYFDEKTIQNGVYNKKDVYFQVYPFIIDSLDNFTKQGIQLKGRFESGGMIPPLEQILTLREDYSLGFNYQTPDEGIPVYNGAGTFYNSVEMSNKGLFGAGQLDYLNTTTFSDEFLFHPDSLMSVGREFNNKKQTIGTPYPIVKSGNNDILWLTKEDKFYAKTKDKPFNMFNDTVNLLGNLLIEPSGMSGDGIMDLKIASIESDNFKFKSEQIISDSADFKMKSKQQNILAFHADNVKVNLDFETGRAGFNTNIDTTWIQFPDNRYISKLDFFSWDMNKEILELGSGKGIEQGDSEDGLIGPRYISVAPGQDSLSFVSGTTIFDYKNSFIEAMEVPYFIIADSRIFPKDGRLTVEKNAVIRRLIGTEMEVDYINKYHKLFNASLDISGKNNYSGSADYSYVDETDKIQVIQMTNLMIDTSGQTIGNGQISILDSFKLSPFYEYQGKVKLSAQNKFLTFDGGVRMVHDCMTGRSWLKFTAEINPDSILIPVTKDPVDINMNKIYTGHLITRDSTHIYSAFLGPRKDYFDAYITTSDGFLTYDKRGQNYKISSPEKLNDESLPGNYLRMNIDSCSLYYEGKMNLQVDFGQLKINSAGSTVSNIRNNTFNAKLLMSLDFFFSDEALSVFASELDSMTDLKPFDLNDPFYKLALRDFIGSEKAEVMEAELGLLGYYREIPSEFNKKLVLSNIHLKWDPDSRSYIYHGPVGVLRAGAVPINKNVETYLQLSKRGSGDLLDIYFKLDDNTWYYFGYNPGSFQVTSSNRRFNDIIFQLKDSSRKMKVPPGQMEFIYTQAPDRRVQLFLRRFMNIEDAEKEN